MAVIIRPRTPRDLDECEQIARHVHATDGYPVFMPDENYRAFVASSDATAAWVASESDEIVGQVALHRRSSASVMNLAAEALGVDEAKLCVVARLVVAPAARRKGVGLLLLETAAREARRYDLVPILDVVTSSEGAVAMYERAGWRRLGKVEQRFGEAMTINEYVYSAPRIPGHPDVRA